MQRYMTQDCRSTTEWRNGVVSDDSTLLTWRPQGVHSDLDIRKYVWTSIWVSSPHPNSITSRYDPHYHALRLYPSLAGTLCTRRRRSHATQVCGIQFTLDLWQQRRRTVIVYALFAGPGIVRLGR